MKLRVYYEDTDSGGIVYHSNYLNFCERARSELFFAQNMTPVTSDGDGFVVHSITAKFLSSAKLGDILNVTTDLLKMKNTSISMRQEIFLEDKKLFSMEALVVFVKNGKPSKIPEEFKNIFKR